MYKILIFSSILQAIVISAFSQSFSFDLSQKFKTHRFELPEKEITGFRLEAIGFNYPIFDFPFFKFSSQRHSVNTRFKSASAFNFGLEYISSISIFGKPHLMGGLYFSDTYFIFDYKKNIPSGLSFNGLVGSVFQVGAGIGLNKTFQLYHRWYIELSFVAVISKVIIPSTSLYDIVDTTWINKKRREFSTQENDRGKLEILYPAQILHPMSLKLRNKVLLNYYFTKTIGMNLSFVYKIGLPNKMLIYQFDYYGPFNRSHPDSHEKVVVSNSSFAWNFGLTINLWNKE